MADSSSNFDLNLSPGRQKAYEYALYLLGLRLRTENELKEKLRIKGYKEAVIDSVMEELKKLKYVDDIRLAETYLENLKKYKTFGYFGIKKKFLEKKFPTEMAERLLRENFTLGEEVKIAKKLLDKKSRGGKAVDKEQFQKLAASLRSKGFRNEAIFSVLNNEGE
jgi:regulatory protein